MQKFNIGEKVIALDNTPAFASGELYQERKKGKIYFVKDILFCNKCGTQCVNIGTNIPPDNCSHSINCKCGNRNPGGNLMWTNSEHFTKAENRELALESAIKNEDYEFAAQLRDMKI